MTAAPNLTRITAESAAADNSPIFPAPNQQTKFTVTVHLDGFPVTVEFTGNGKKLKEVIAGLKQAGATPPPIRTGGSWGGKREDALVEPAYDAHGNEICPVHKTRIREYTTKDGRTFKGCPSKATGVAGEKANERGYCAMRFK